MPIKTPVSLRLDRELVDIIREESRKRRLSQGEIVSHAVRSVFSPGAEVDRTAALSSRLNRIDRKHELLLEDVRILTETVALFSEIFLTITPEVPDRDRPSAEANGKRRFRKFLETLQGRISSGDGFLGEVVREREVDGE